MEVREVVNVNDNICNWDQKIKRMSYNTNRDHKAKCLNKYRVFDYYFNTNEKEKCFSHFNFKKTNARKKKFSCGGYGGKCAGCKSTYNEPKLMSKYTV